jgi:hypothetical protein
MVRVFKMILFVGHPTLHLEWRMDLSATVEPKLDQQLCIIAMTVVLALYKDH